MRCRIIAPNSFFLFLALALLLPLTRETAFCGGSGLNVIVIVNQNSTNSVQLGNAYCELRGVPPENLMRITNWTGGRVAWTRTEFETRLKQPLMGLLSARGLTNQAQFALLSMDVPYRVTDTGHENSTTAALFYGFKSNTAPPFQGLPASCSLPDNSFNSYAFSERAFADSAPDTAETNSLLTFLLTDTNLDRALKLLTNGVAADQTSPTNPAYLAQTTDVPRNVRAPLFDNGMFEAAVAGGRTVLQTNTDSIAFHQVGGLETGLYSFSVPGSAFVPGSIADTLTSFAGGIFENFGQSVLLEFLHGGAVASYGTVVEPCNYTEKFPDPRVYFYQSRGFSAAEAYYMSVRNPYQGLYVGEPLAAPFAVSAALDWIGLPEGAVLVGTTNLLIDCEASAPDHPIGRLDFYVDGRFHHTLTNIAPSAGNTVNVSVKGATVSYHVPAGATILSVADDLTTALNQQGNRTAVQASAIGDRVLLSGLDYTKVGSTLPLTASSAAGTAAGITTWVKAARPTFLDSPARGYVSALISNTPAVGDWVQLEVTKTNGSIVTLGVTNTSAQGTAVTLAQSLTNLVLSTPELQVNDGIVADWFYTTAGNFAAGFVFKSRTPGWPAARLQVKMTASPGMIVSPSSVETLEENLSDLGPRDHLYIASGSALFSLAFPLDTTLLSDGFHELNLVAIEGTSIRTQTRLSRQVRVQNTGLSATINSHRSGYAVVTDTAWTIGVTANGPGIARIELFSTGGSIGAASGTSTYEFPVPAQMLGLGTHPFYAVVTDSQGASYRTETIRIRLIPPFAVSLNREASVLSWNSIPGLMYEVQRTADLSQPFQFFQSLVATGSTAQILLPSGYSDPAFYRVRLVGN